MLKLIMAGQIARQKTLEPLRFFDLEPGDDAVLFALSPNESLSDPELAELTGQSLRDLLGRLQRLLHLGLVVRDNGTRLSARGAEASNSLQQHWLRLDAKLFSGTKKKNRRRFRRLLDHLIRTGLV